MGGERKMVRETGGGGEEEGERRREEEEEGEEKERGVGDGKELKGERGERDKCSGINVCQRVLPNMDHSPH